METAAEAAADDIAILGGTIVRPAGAWMGPGLRFAEAEEVCWELAPHNVALAWVRCWARKSCKVGRKRHWG